MESMKIEIADMIDEIINSQQAFKPSSKLESGLKSYYDVLMCLYVCFVGRD